MHEQRASFHCRFAVAMLFAFAGVFSACASSDCDVCSREIAQLGISEVCGSDGFTYIRPCLAECQHVVVAYNGKCKEERAAAGSAAAVAAHSAALPQQVVGSTAGATGAGAAVATAAAPLLLDAATITAYAKDGLRCLGYMTRTTFEPETPVISMKRFKALQRKRQVVGATMMVTAQGVLYAAPAQQQRQLLLSDVNEVRTDGSEMQQAQPATSSPVDVPAGRRLLRARAAAATAPQALLRGVRRLLRVATHEAAGGSLWDSAGTAGRRVKAIFGQDTRREIPVTPTDALYTPVGHILFTSVASGARYQCTGAMIGHYTVLTAAHCLVDRSGNMQANIEFTPGQTYRNQSGLGTAKGVRVYFNKEYLGDNWENYDVGVLVLDRPFGVYTKQHYEQQLMSQLQVTPENQGGRGGRGPVGMDNTALSEYQLRAWLPKRFGYAAGTERLVNARMFSAGYPGDKKFNSFWRVACMISEPPGPVGPIVVNYCPSVPGQSGAPFVEVRAAKQGTQRLVRAVNSFEMCDSICDGRCCNGVVAYNGAVRITPEIKAFIDQHVDQQPDSLMNASPSPSPNPGLDQQSPLP